MGVSVCEAPSLVLMSFVCGGFCGGANREVPVASKHTRASRLNVYHQTWTCTREASPETIFHLTAEFNVIVQGTAPV